MVGVIHVVDVAGPLPVDLMNGPDGFRVALVGVGFFDFVPKLIFKGFNDRFDDIVA